MDPLKPLSYFVAIFFSDLCSDGLFVLSQIIWEQKEESGIFMALGVSGIRLNISVGNRINFAEIDEEKYDNN